MGDDSSMTDSGERDQDIIAKTGGLTHGQSNAQERPKGRENTKGPECRGTKVKVVASRQGHQIIYIFCAKIVQRD